MIELIIMVYALAYVGMEFVWVCRFRVSLMEDILHPTSWRGDRDTFFTILVLLVLPATFIAALLTILKERIDG